MTYIDLVDILSSDKPSYIIRCNENAIFSFIPELKRCKGFDQKNEWHVYDVYEHILHVVDGVFNNDCLRLAALFHDIGKPLSFIEDENGVGHFYGHWDKSNEIFREFAKKNNLDDNTISVVTKLIFYHDLNFAKYSDDDLKRITEIFSKEEIEMLYNLKRADILAQNKKFHDMKLKEYDEQENKIMSLYGYKTNR